MLQEEKGRINHIDSKLKPINIINDICKSICKINTNESFGSGFFIKLVKGDQDFYCLISCEHVITKKKLNLIMK